MLIKTNLYKKTSTLSWSSHYVVEIQTLDKKYLHYAHASNRQGCVRKRSPWLRAQWHNIIQTSKVSKKKCVHCRFYGYLIVYCQLATNGFTLHNLPSLMIVELLTQSKKNWELGEKRLPGARTCGKTNVSKDVFTEDYTAG